MYCVITLLLFSVRLVSHGFLATTFNLNDCHRDFENLLMTFVQIEGRHKIGPIVLCQGDARTVASIKGPQLLALQPIKPKISKREVLGLKA